MSPLLSSKSTRSFARAAPPSPLACAQLENSVRFLIHVSCPFSAFVIRSRFYIATALPQRLDYANLSIGRKHDELLLVLLRNSDQIPPADKARSQIVG